MKKQAILIPLFCKLLIILTLLVSSCQKDTAGYELSDKDRNHSNNLFKDGEDVLTCDTVVYDIYGGQNILVGNLVVTNDGTNLYITYQTDGCWELAETHLFVGDIADLPTNKANVPIPGHFPYSETHSDINSYTYSIPLADLPECYAIAAHAAVLCEGDEGEESQEETAWSFGTEFPDTNRWGWYSEYCTQYCEG